MRLLMRDVVEWLDNLGHVVKLPRFIQSHLCDRVDSFYRTPN